jgi:hypothetical protein
MTTTLTPTSSASPSPKGVLVARTGWLRSSTAPGLGARAGFPGAGSITGLSAAAGGGADSGASGAGAGGGPYCTEKLVVDVDRKSPDATVVVTSYVPVLAVAGMVIGKAVLYVPV